MLPIEEHIEQAFFFDAFLESLENGVSTQDFLSGIRNELLTTTQLPMAIDFLLTDMKHTGVLSAAMFHLEHYFTPFQAFVIAESEREEGRFDIRIALKILAREAKYRSESSSVQGLFFYQFETICRNRLGYDKGIDVLMRDDIYDENWKEWLKILRRQIGLVDLADMIFYRSEFYKQKAIDLKEERPEVAVLFGEREGRIAFATRKRDPVYLFSALSRHLGYPGVPRQQPAVEEENLIPVLQRRIEHLENRLQLFEEELRGGINLNRYFVKGDADK